MIGKKVKFLFHGREIIGIVKDEFGENWIVVDTDLSGNPPNVLIAKDLVKEVKKDARSKQN